METMTSLSYIHTPADFTYRYQTVSERLELQARIVGNKEVYVLLGPDGSRTSITAIELFERSKRLAQWFIKRGIKKGDVIALCLGNDLYGLIGMFGVMLSGAIVLNCVSSREDGTDLKRALLKSDAKAFLIHTGNSDSTLRACMKFVEEFDGNGNAKSDALPLLKFFVTTTSVKNHTTLSLDYILRSDEVHVDLPRLDMDDVVIMFTTSGSTGMPKFAQQTHFGIMIICHHLQHSMMFDSDDVIYSERRFAWLGGFPFMLLHNGVKVVTKTSAFSDMKQHCEFTLNALIKEHCTFACLFPATIIGINDLITSLGDCHLNLKGIHTGALPVALSCFSAIGQYTQRVTNCYGSSEDGAITSLQVTNVNGVIEYNTGQPHAGVEVKIVNQNGAVVERGETGGIHVRTPALFRGYYNDEKKTEEVLFPSGWFNTDDTGYITESGDLVITGRQSDIILQGGKVYAPSVVEGIIKAHPGVLDVVAVPVPDEVLFQVVCACIIAKSGFTLTAMDMKEFYKSTYVTAASEAFSGFIPRMFLMFSDYPRLYNGKPDKKKLAEEALSRKKECL